MAYGGLTSGSNSLGHAGVQALTVHQIEVLAKAGVRVELSGPVAVRDDPPYETITQHGSPDHLLKLVRERWVMAMRAKYDDLRTTPYYADPLSAAVSHGDKVYVFAGGGSIEPQIIIDEKCIFPSDALLAKLHLMMEHSNAQP